MINPTELSWLAQLAPVVAVVFAFLFCGTFLVFKVGFRLITVLRDDREAERALRKYLADTQQAAVLQDNSDMRRQMYELLANLQNNFDQIHREMLKKLEVRTERGST